MSMGIGGSCKKSVEDETTVLYEYSVYNLNDPNLRAAINSYDGTIKIEKSALINPVIHKKLKRQPNGKKRMIEKRIPVNVPIDSLIAEHKVEITNCSRCWLKTPEEYDVIAVRLCDIIFREYQITGILPEKASYHI